MIFNKEHSQIFRQDCDSKIKGKNSYFHSSKEVMRMEKKLQYSLIKPRFLVSVGFAN